MHFSEAETYVVIDGTLMLRSFLWILPTIIDLLIRARVHVEFISTWKIHSQEHPKANQPTRKKSQEHYSLVTFTNQWDERTSSQTRGQALIATTSNRLQQKAQIVLAQYFTKTFYSVISRTSVYILQAKSIPSIPNTGHVKQPLSS